MTKSLKLDIFHGTLGEMLNNHYPDYRIGEYFNSDCSSVAWLSVFDHYTKFKIAEAIAIEKFTSRDDTTSLLVVDYVNSDSRRYTDVEQALSFMRSILMIASDRKKIQETKSAIEANEKQCEQENTINLESLRDDVIKTGVIDPNKCYLVTGRRNGKMMYYHAFLRYLFGLKIKDVIFNDPATIIFWEDGEKTIVQCQDGEEFDPEKGLAMAISKKIFGNKYAYYDVFKKWVGKYKKKKFREALDKAMEITPDEILRDGHRYVLADHEVVAKPKEETVIASLTLSDISLSPEDAAAVLKPYCDKQIEKPEDNNETSD